MENRHEVIKNRFYRLDLPTIKLVRRIDIITVNDIEVLRKELKRIKRKDILCAVDLMEKYGERVGVFENMEIDDKGNWNSVSKESMRTGKFTMNELKKINETGLLKLRKCTIQNTILKYTKKLYKEEKISCAFSCHDIRHYRITEDMKNTKNGEEMIKVSRRYHKNINTTLGYVNFQRVLERKTTKNSKKTGKFFIFHIVYCKYIGRYEIWEYRKQEENVLRAPLETPFTRQKKMIKYKHETERIF
jgi:hypothetical protein